MGSSNKIIDECIDKFINEIYLGKIEDEQSKAEKSLILLEKIIMQIDSSRAREYLNALGLLKSVLHVKFPSETTPYNMTLKVIKIVKDEHIKLQVMEPEDKEQFFMRNFPQPKPTEPSPTELWDKEVDRAQFKENVLVSLAEQKAEVEQSREVIASQGETFFHNDEIILTGGYCPNVLAFLLAAAKERKFHVIVAESCPTYNGVKMGKLLAAAQISTTLIQDRAVFAMMSRINKVVIGCKTVLVNGGIRTALGCPIIGSAALYHKVPLHVCAPTYLFSNERSNSVDEFDDPRKILPEGHFSELDFPNVNICVSKYGVVPPHQITSFITNNQGIAPSYAGRLVRDAYQPNADTL